MSGGTIQGAVARATDTSVSGMSSLDHDLRRIAEAHAEEAGDLVPVPRDNLADDLENIVDEAPVWDVTGNTPRAQERLKAVGTVALRRHDQGRNRVPRWGLQCHPRKTRHQTCQRTRCDLGLCWMMVR